MTLPKQPPKLPRSDWMWTHKEKGGEYLITSFTSGSGALNGKMLVHYRSVGLGGPGQVFSRLLEEWDDKMEPARV